MWTFTVDARNGSEKDTCNTCCCERISARAGEKNKVLINYGPWSAPIGGHGLVQKPIFDIECLTCSADAPPVVQPGFGRTVQGENYTGNLAPLYVGEEPVVFTELELFPPSYGDVTINGDGTFVYVPNTLFSGIDRFYWSANGEVAEFVVAVDPSETQELPQPPFTPPVSIPASRVSYDLRMHIMSFVLAISPAAKTGDIYRLNIRQKTMDCNGDTFEHISCYDITIGKC